MKKALMIIAIVVIIAIAGSMIYYFVFFRPGIAKAEIMLQEENRPGRTRDMLRDRNYQI
ncbi:MAG: hypothetical protein ACYDIA_00665 [Candidatus Humimicrobiaceae bacterium]